MATIPYSDVITTERLPIDAQDIATRVHLVIAGSRVGPEPDSFMNFELAGTFPGFDRGVSYIPRPLVYRYVADSDITAEASLALPQGTEVFLAPDDASIDEPTVTGFTNPGSPSAVRDGDGTTYASGTGTIEYAQVVKASGFRLVYTATEAGSVNLQLHPNVLPVATWVVYDLPAAIAPAEVVVIVPLDARTAWENAGGATPLEPSAPYGALRGYPTRTNVSLSFSSGAAKIFEFYPLIPDEALLESIAKANIKLPASAPKRVTVRGIVAPDRAHTITGWPGGDLTASVAQQQYELGRTVIDFEQAGSPVGLPAEAIEAARERRAAVQSEIRLAGYSLKMGERQ